MTQEDGHMAWSSPIWVDYIPGSATGKGTIKPRPVKTTKPQVHLDDLDTDLDNDEEL